MDTATVFADNAPLYWNAGLPVIPLYPFDAPVKSPGKAPIPTGWQQYASTMPSEAVRDHWLASFPDSNIGLPLGTESGLMAIDIDTEDPALIAAIEDCLPASPWVRIGRKGKGLVYRFTGVRNFKIKTEKNESIVEALGAGNQIVVCGIHPATRAPYASNVPLYDVLAKVQPCPKDIEEQLRAALSAAGVKLGVKGRTAPTDVVPSGERDTQMTRHAGYLARVVLGIDKSVVWSLQEAIDQMFHWVEAYTARVAGDDMDPKKGVAKLLEFLLRDLEKGRTLPEGWESDLREEWDTHPTIEVLRLKNARARWSVSRGREWLQGKIAEQPNDDDWVLARTGELISLVASDDQFGEGDIRALVGCVLPLIGKIGLKKGDLMAMFREARRGSGSDEWEDQELIGRRVLEELEKGGAVLHSGGRFWQWSGARWAELDDKEVYKAAAAIKGSVLLRRNSDYEAVVKVCARLAAGELEAGEERGLNFANGWLDTGLVLHDHDPKYGATFTLPFEWGGVGGDKCPRFFEFLEGCWGGDVEKILMLQEAIAATMFGLMPMYQKAVLLHGRAGTGKTVLMRIVESLMPPEAMTAVAPQQWGERFAMGSLLGKVLNLCGELPEHGYIPGNIFKQVVDGSPFQSEFKGVDTFVFRSKAANWFAGNYLPASKDSSEGFTRRWLVFGFSRVVPKDEVVEDLAEQIIAEEREGIVAWALQGLSRLMAQRKFTEGSEHLALLAEMRRVNNSVLAWIESNGRYLLTREQGDTCEGLEMYDQYSFYVKNINRGFAAPYERFIQMLYDMGLGREQVADAHGAIGWKITGVRRV